MQTKKVVCTGKSRKQETNERNTNVRISHVLKRFIALGLTALLACLLAVAINAPHKAEADEEVISVDMPSSVSTGGALMHLVFRVRNPGTSTFFFDGVINVPNDFQRTDGSVAFARIRNSDVYWNDARRNLGSNIYWRGQLEPGQMAELAIEMKSGTQAGTHEFLKASFLTTQRGSEVVQITRELTLTAKIVAPRLTSAEWGTNPKGGSTLKIRGQNLLVEGSTMNLNLVYTSSNHSVVYTPGSLPGMDWTNNEITIPVGDFADFEGFVVLYASNAGGMATSNEIEVSPHPASR